MSRLSEQVSQLGGFRFREELDSRLRYLSLAGILLLKPKTAVEEAAYLGIPKNASSARVPRAFQILMTS